MDLPDDLLERLPVAIARLDRSRQIVAANDYLCRVVGRDRSEVLGRECHELGIGPVDVERFDHSVDACFATGELQRMYRPVWLAGERRLVDYRFLADDPREEPPTILMLAWINPTAEAFEDLAEDREELLRQFLDHAPVFAWLRGADDQVYRMVNRTYLDRYGLEEGDVVGRTVFDRWPGEAGRSFAANDRVVAETGVPHSFIEHAPDPGGQRRTFLNVKFRVDDTSHGQPLVGSVGMDITDRLELDRRVAVLERMRLDAALTVGAAHDLANDIMRVRGLIQDLEAELPTYLDEDDESRARASVLSSLHDTLDQATDRLVAMRTTGVQHPPDDARTELAEVVEATLNHLREEVSAELVLSPTSPGVPSAVRGLVRPLQQVVENLVRNADEAGAGRVHLWLTRQRDPRGALPGVYVVLHVADDGPGIDDEVRERLFEPYVSTKGPTRGLGLAGVRAIVEAHQGTLSVSSTTGGGSRFEIALPAAV